MRASVKAAHMTERAAAGHAASRDTVISIERVGHVFRTKGRRVEKLMDAARGNRWGHRDATAILIAYRHGLRASELVALRWDDIDFTTGKLHVRRAKGGYGQRASAWGARSYGRCAGSQREPRKGCTSSCLSAWHR